MTRSTCALLVAGGGVLTIAGLLSCGGDNPVTPTTTTTTTTTPTTTLPSSGLHCSPTPPPLYRVTIKIHGGGDGRRVLDSRPWVINVNGYCEKHNGKGGAFCPAAAEGAPDAVDCDKMAMGQAADTGRWGPTWKYKADGGSPAQPCGENPNPGCINHPDNQFLVIAKGSGVFQACADPSIPLSTDPNYKGGRCGLCQLRDNADKSCD